ARALAERRRDARGGARGGGGGRHSQGRRARTRPDDRYGGCRAGSRAPAVAAAATPRRDLRRRRRDACLARSAGPDPRYCRQGRRYGRLRRRLHGQPARRYRGAGRRLRLGGAPRRHRPASRGGGRVRGDGGGGDGRAADLGPTRRPSARGSVSPAHRAQARAIGGVVDGRPPRNANSGRAKQKKPRADAFRGRSRETGHAGLLQVGVAAEHRPMRIGDGARQFEDNRVEKNEARLLEKAAPELSGRFDRGVEDAVGEPGKLAVRLTGNQGDPGPFRLRDASEMKTDRGLAGARDDAEPIPRADGRGGGLADKMRAVADVHETHRRHPRDEARTPLSGEEPPASLIPEDVHQGFEGARTHARQGFGYFASDGQPRPGSRNRSLIHLATPWGSSAPVMALPTTTISGSTRSTASRFFGPNPPASATRKPRRRISKTASM